MPRTGFDPRAHGFHFANDFVDKVVSVPGYGEVATDGRSGGMAYAALDYWFAGLPVPSHLPEDFPDKTVPEDGTRLADYLYKRLFDSFAAWSARQFVTWALAADHPTWSYEGVTAWTRDELQRLRRGLDAGRPQVLGLVGARGLEELARNRQVVAYGYDDDGSGAMRVYLYDSNHPDTEVVLEAAPDAPQLASSAPGGPWRGLFVQDYTSERPPYVDIGAAKGIWVNSWTPTLGGNFVAQFTARNYGDYRAHLAELRLAVRGPAGENLDRFLGGDGDPTPLEPGEERGVFKASDGFGTVAGSYAIAAGYLSESGRFLVVPPMEPGAVDEVGVTVVPPLHRTRVTVTFGRVIVEDAAALGGRLALCLAVGDQTARWPDDGAIDVEDGKVFELDRRFDLVLNPASVLWVAVTGDGAGGTPCGVVREPYLALHDWGAGEHGYRSRLGHPDDPERPGPDAGQARSPSSSPSSRPRWTPSATRYQPITRRLAASARPRGEAASAASSRR